ncbi:MAG: SPOR domain-containing protein [Rhizobiales bacterium]|nr:SPOR domain-containing protein [Hyphomicrobiales bacterium]
MFLAASAAASGSLAATPNASTQLATAAYRALAEGDAATAVASYTTAIESRDLEPEVLANALLNRGLAYQRLNQPELAIADYSAAMRIDAMTAKLRAMALYNRGLAYQKLQQSSRAIEDFTSALFLDPGFAHAYYSRGNLLRESGQYLFALADYTKAIQFNHPEPARVHYGEALAYEGLGRPANARTALNQALSANPDFAPAKLELAALDNPVQGEGATASDQITTASIAETQAVKQVLPVATAPSAELAGDGTNSAQITETAPPKKTIVDRVPVVETAEAVPPTDTTERIVAVEPVSTGTEQAAATGQSVADAPASETPITGWAVQIASAGSEDAAWSAWKKMQAAHRVLADKKPVVVKADLGTKGTFYRLRLTGYDTQIAAKSACSRLKTDGVSCYISKASS